MTLEIDQPLERLKKLVKQIRSKDITITVNSLQVLARYGQVNHKKLKICGDLHEANEIASILLDRLENEGDAWLAEV